MAFKGYISINRSIEDHWLWQQKPFSKGQAWIDLLILANHAEVKQPHGDTVNIYQRGVVHRSIYFLAERWGWDRRTVKRFLNVLESDEMVSVNGTTNGTTITIVNYGKYQNGGTTHGTTDGTTHGTTHGTQTIMTNNDQKGGRRAKRAEPHIESDEEILAQMKAWEAAGEWRNR